MGIKLDIFGSKKKPESTYVSREYVIDRINSLNLDDKTYDELVKQIYACPDQALSYFLNNINNVVNNIRSK